MGLTLGSDIGDDYVDLDDFISMLIIIIRQIAIFTHLITASHHSVGVAGFIPLTFSCLAGFQDQHHHHYYQQTVTKKSRVETCYFINDVPSAP